MKNSKIDESQNKDNSFYFLGLPFLLVIYGCIFFRIDRWPLSDYSMFSFYHTPNSINTYRLGLAQDQKWVTWLYPEKTIGYNKNQKFYNEVIFIVKNNPDATKQMMTHHLDSARQLAIQLQLSNPQLALFKQTVVMKEKKMSSTKISFELGLDL